MTLYLVPLSKSEEERYNDLIEKNIFLSLHEHPYLFPEDMSQLVEYVNSGRCFTAYEALSASGIALGFFSIVSNARRLVNLK